MKSLYVMIILFLAAAGCRPDVYELDERDLASPAVAAAAARAAAGDHESAIAMYNDALSAEPENARIHLDLGLLYDGLKSDWVRAVYHYQRYLEMRPDSEKQTMIGERIESARIALAEQYGHGVGALRGQVSELKDENQALRDIIELLRRELEERPDQVAARPERADTPSEAPSRAGSSPEPAEGEARDVRYTIQARDSLTSLARQFYGDSRQWQKIHEANRERIPDPNVLPVGATIVIPDVEPSFRNRSG